MHITNNNIMPTPSATPKDPKNLQCECGSKKKAKHCCMKNLPAIYKTTQEKSSENVMDCMALLMEKFPSHKIIDITDRLNNLTYKPFQIANYTEPIIMVAEKTEANATVFSTRVDSAKSDMMVLYHGAFRTFPHEYLERVIDSVCAMIN
jgi:hypothetical protein